jgi:hypothetical protein
MVSADPVANAAGSAFFERTIIEALRLRGAKTRSISVHKEKKANDLKLHFTSALVDSTRLTPDAALGDDKTAGNALAKSAWKSR